MGIRKYKPTTPGRRGASVSDFAEITRSTPEKSLVQPLHGRGGRNAHGRITTRHKGGGHKRAYRVIDFRRNDKDGVNAKVAHIEYDPNRTANIALLHYLDGEKRYIIAPHGLSQGDVVESGANADIKPGNNLPLRNIPAGTLVHAVEMRPGGAAATAARALGLGASLIDGQVAAIQVLAVDSGDGFIAFAIVCHFHKAKAARLAGVAIRNEVDATDSPVSCEQRTDRIFRSPKAEVSNEYIFQVNLLPFLI